jgi:hypothetical protein
MYALVRIFAGGGHPASDLSEAARARVEVLDTTPGFVTLLAIKGDDGALIVVEIFETLGDMTAALAVAWHDARLSPSPGGPQFGRTISGEIVFQRGL